MDAVERPFTTIDVHLVDGLPAHERGKQSRQSKDVVEMPVGDENVIQILESDSGLQDLALRALTAVNQETVLVVLEDLRGKSAFGGRGGGGGAQKDDFKHKEYCTSFKKQEAFLRNYVTLPDHDNNHFGQLQHNVPLPLGKNPILVSIIGNSSDE